MVHINRRSFLQVGSLGLAGLLTGRDLAVSEEGVRPAGTANACIFIKLIGGPSHVDTFDLKVGPWTPRDFDITDCGHLWLSRKLFPTLCRLSPHLSVVRSVRAWGLEHNQAHYALMAGRKFNPGFVSEIPHIGSVVALEAALGGQTGPFPPFMAFNGGGGELESGFLPSRYSPFATFTATPNIGRPVTIEDIAATIYSSLGINWTKEIRETPSGRVFRYTPHGHDPVYSLFQERMRAGGNAS